MLKKLSPGCWIAPSNLTSAASSRQKLLHSTFIKRSQRKLTPLQPAAETNQQVTLCTDGLLCIPLNRKLLCKTLDVWGQRSIA
jgi:hypothetical protein